jgi:hypothetical protein
VKYECNSRLHQTWGCALTVGSWTAWFAVCSVALASFATILAIGECSLPTFFPASAFASCNFWCSSATLSFNFTTCKFWCSAVASCEVVGRSVLVLSAIGIGAKFGKGGGVREVSPPGKILEGSGTVNAVDGAGTLVLVFVPPGIIFEGSGTVIDVAVEFKEGGGVEFKDGGGTLMHGSRSVIDVEEDGWLLPP